MVRKKNNWLYPVKTCKLGEKRAKKQMSYNYKAECEIRLCCVCDKPSNGNPCEELKAAYAEARKQLKERKNGRTFN